jgi:hypothetical protein
MFIKTMKHKEATVTRYLCRDMFNETLKYTKHMKELFFLGDLRVLSGDKNKIL